MEKYKMIANDIADKIASGELLPGDKLPSELELCEDYNVSRITIKKATDYLLNRGLINKRRGSGTFVKDIAETNDKVHSYEEVTFAGFTKKFEGQKVTTKVLLFEIIPAEGEVAEFLHLTPDDFVYHIIRTRGVNNKTHAIEYIYMPINVIPGITKSILEGSIYSYISDTLGFKPQSAHRTVRALLPTEEEKKYFKEKTPYAILEIAQVGYLNDGRIFEYSKAHHSGNMYVFKSVSVSS